MKHGIKTVAGRRVCATVYDGKGRAHLLHPVQKGRTVCDRELDAGALHPSGKVCFACAELAPAANKVLRLLHPAKKFF